MCDDQILVELRNYLSSIATGNFIYLHTRLQIQLEAELLVAAQKFFDNNLTQMADLFGVHRLTLVKRLKKHNIFIPQRKSPWNKKPSLPDQKL